MRLSEVVRTDLQAGVGPVVVGAGLAGDASSRATFALVPEAHSSLLGLLEDLDLRLHHCRDQRSPKVSVLSVDRQHQDRLLNGLLSSRLRVFSEKLLLSPFNLFIQHQKMEEQQILLQLLLPKWGFFAINE